jgi:hypothetical protein
VGGSLAAEGWQNEITTSPLSIPVTRLRDWVIGWIFALWWGGFVSHSSAPGRADDADMLIAVTSSDETSHDRLPGRLHALSYACRSPAFVNRSYLTRGGLFRQYPSTY